jgi:hypothetical protein
MAYVIPTTWETSATRFPLISVPPVRQSVSLINRSLTKWPLGGAITPCSLISFVFSSPPVL